MSTRAAYCLKCSGTDIWIRRHRTRCADGTTLSIQVGENLYCTPRDNSGDYTHVEVGFIQDSNGNSVTPPPEWQNYADGTFPSDVYAYVPVIVVENFISQHGGRVNFV